MTHEIAQPTPIAVTSPEMAEKWAAPVRCEVRPQLTIPCLVQARMLISAMIPKTTGTVYFSNDRIR